MGQSEDLTKIETLQSELDRNFNHLYDSIRELRLGLMIVEKDEMYGAINNKGEIIIPLKYHYISDFFKRTAIVYKTEETESGEETLKAGLINTKGKLITPIIYDEIEESPYREFSVPIFNAGLLKVKRDGLYGYINEKGEEIIPPIYKDAKAFADSGLAGVKKENKWGMINTVGKLMIDYEYDDILEQNSKIGYIIVQIGEKPDMINYYGKIISNDELERMFEAKRRK